MKREVKKLWLDALKSGEYKQGKGNLKLTKAGKPDQHCCLGVLCELSITNQYPSSAWRDNRGSGRSEGRALAFTLKSDAEDTGLTAFPPTPVMRWAGLTNEDALDLSVINDRTRTPENDNFADVIAEIEANL